MNLPNKLTLFRVILTPFFVFFALYEGVADNYLFALIIFAAAALTDALDGHIARKRGLITNFGKFMDPLADKVLVIAALVCLMKAGLCGAVPLIAILAREFMVDGLRLVTAESGVVVPAGVWGKLKTAFTMAAVVISYAALAFFSEAAHQGALYAVIQSLIWISAALTVISGLVYLKGYSKYIRDK